jgi:hypothetical protein
MKIVKLGPSYIEQLTTVHHDLNNLDSEPFALEMNVYDMTSFTSVEHMRSYFGDIWDRWYSDSRNKLLIEVSREVPNGYYNRFYAILVYFCRHYGIDNRLVILTSNNIECVDTGKYINQSLPNAVVDSINYLEWDAAYHYHPLKLVDRKYDKRRFLMLSRSYKPWRHYIVGRLYVNNILDNFYYSFYNCEPYRNIFYDQSYIKEQLQTIEPNNIVKDFTVRLDHSDFYEKLPIRLTHEQKILPHDLNRLYDDNIHSLYVATDIDIVIETLFQSPNDNFHPTEKIWKSIVYRKPFIVFSTKNFLAHMRDQGYKTFHPWINENYDSVEDKHQRAEMIIDEIHRINNFSEQELSELLTNCREICEHNYQRLHLRLQDFYHGCDVSDTTKELLNVKSSINNRLQKI